MGIKERKNRHKEDLRQRILDAAKKLFLKEGYGATSIRKIAAEIEFSPTTIYLYYDDKAAIAYALHQEGFRLMRVGFEALHNVDNPFERLKAMGRAYLKFSLENPDFYELMFVMKEPMDFIENFTDGKEDGEWEEGMGVFDMLVQTVEECQRIGYFVDQETRVFSFLIWSTVHGICTLSLHGHLEHACMHKMIGKGSSEIIDAALENFIALLNRMKD
ncbi:TetR/AcrR family transcriptional regulator [Olivibacter sitiensis]|uniref:TetR/AcrR family transcriptional regulator n=1 Tax=Olivibacter sitiensis TaxID=376470 RepID=UPI0003FA0FE6|nr:TetR/AcrR family transcriptional regulator [Olivibacter sitiensis]